MTIKVLFSPHGQCLKEILNELANAKKNVHILAYTFTSRPIVDTFIELIKSSIPIKVIGDSQGAFCRGSVFNTLHSIGPDSSGNALIECRIDRKHAIAHSKIIIIDEETVITGSYNFTNAAENVNSENLIIIKNEPEIVKAYLSNFWLHYNHSVTYLPIMKEDIVTNGQLIGNRFDPTELEKNQE